MLDIKLETREDCGLGGGESEGLPEGDLIAAGYETACPKCGTEYHLIEIPHSDQVAVCTMLSCGQRFRLGLAEHAYD